MSYAKVDPGVTSYRDTGVTKGTTYWYYVQAVDKAGNVGAASNTASAKLR